MSSKVVTQELAK